MQFIERVILGKLLAAMREAGHSPVAVWDGEEYQGAKATGDADVIGDKPAIMSDKEVLAAVDSVDFSTIHFTHRNTRTWGNRGVFVVLGNGEDVISDHHVAANEPTFQAVIDALSAEVYGK